MMQKHAWSVNLLTKVSKRQFRSLVKNSGLGMALMATCRSCTGLSEIADLYNDNNIEEEKCKMTI